MKPTDMLIPVILFCISCTPQEHVDVSSSIDVEKAAQQL